MDADQKLTEVLAAKNKDKCPKCNKQIDRGDVAWNTASTESGTPYSVMEIICEKCFTEIYHGTTWFEIESFEEFVKELEENLE